MASRQDPTAADIAYAQYSAAEKTRTVGGRVYHRIICKTPLPAPVGGVELILPRAMFVKMRVFMPAGFALIAAAGSAVGCWNTARNTTAFGRSQSTSRTRRPSAFTSTWALWPTNAPTAMSRAGRTRCCICGGRDILKAQAKKRGGAALQTWEENRL